MIVVLRVIGWMLLVAALLTLGWDIFFWIHDGQIAFTPAGKAWYAASPRSFNFAERVIGGHIWKTLWDPVILTVLLQPLCLVLGVPGLLLVALTRTRKRRRFAR